MAKKQSPQKGRPDVSALGRIVQATNQAAANQAKQVAKAIKKAGITGLIVPIPPTSRGRKK